MPIAVASLGLTPGIFVLDGFTPQQIRSQLWHARMMVPSHMTSVLSLSPFDRYLVLAPDLMIVAVSEAYLQATLTKRGEILGQHLFEIFPNNPDDPSATGVSNLRTSLDRVLQHRAPDTMAVQKYDICRPESEGGGFEERYWSPVNSPVLETNGEVAYIIHRVVDVTDFVHMKQAGDEQQRMTEELRVRATEMEADIFRRAQQIQEVNNRLRIELEARKRTEDAHTLLANIVESSDDGIYSVDLAGIIVSWNQGPSGSSAIPVRRASGSRSRDSFLLNGWTKKRRFSIASDGGNG